MLLDYKYLINFVEYKYHMDHDKKNDSIYIDCFDACLL